jgi:hypothetical protein
MSIFGEPIKYIYFKNATDLPVQIGSWVDRSNTMKFIRIGPGEKWMVHSSVGEWHMDSMFEHGTDRDAWTKAGLADHHIIGKFRSRPCISGEYASMEYWKPFDCIYSETNEEIKGLITFIHKS